MFFFLSKTVSIFSQPLTIIIILLLAGALVRSNRWKKRLFWTGFGLLIFFTNGFLSMVVMRAWEIPATPYQETSSYTLGIVLTGVTESKRIPADRTYFSKGADRVMHAFELYKMGKIDKILVTGGSGSLWNPQDKEAFKLQRVFRLMGVAEGDLLIEPESRNTHENAINSAEVINSQFGNPSCLLITSAFHMRRAAACFRKAGLQVDLFATDYYTSQPRIRKIFVFELAGLVRWSILFKEWVGYLAYWVMGYV